MSPVAYIPSISGTLDDSLFVQAYDRTNFYYRLDIVLRAYLSQVSILPAGREGSFATSVEKASRSESFHTNGSQSKKIISFTVSDESQTSIYRN